MPATEILFKSKNRIKLFGYLVILNFKYLIFILLLIIRKHDLKLKNPKNKEPHLKSSKETLFE